MTVTYEPTGDGNTFKKIITSEGVIYLDVLEGEIKDLQRQIDEVPKPKTKPDQETLECYNNQIGLDFDKEGTEHQLKEKQDLLKKLKALM